MEHEPDRPLPDPSVPTPTAAAPSAWGQHAAGGPPARPAPAADSAVLTTYDILPVAPEGTSPAPARGVGRWTVAGVLAVVLALVAGGVVVGLKALSGGGTQPEQLVPSTAFAFAKVDLDPAAGQKLDAIRFLRSFPQLKGSVGADSDLRQAVFDATAPQAKKAGVDYGRDVKPWLGSRIGVAALPPEGASGAPEVVGVLQVTDERRARATLTRLKGAAGIAASAGFVLKDGWAVLAPSDAQARSAVAAAERSPLSSSGHYAADLKRLGEDGVATAWVDAGAAGSALGSPGAAGALGGLDGLGGTVGLGPLAGLGLGVGSATAPSHARLAYALRFAGPKVLEVTGFETGTSGTVPRRPPVRAVATLPASTVVAFGASGLDASTDALWKRLQAMGRAPSGVSSAGANGKVSASLDVDGTVREVKRRYGISLPADLKTLFGSQTTVALDATGLSVDGTPSVGVRAVTDPAKGTALAQKVARALGSGAPVTAVVRRTADGYVLASTSAEAARLASTGTLGQRADFRSALPDAASAQVALFVDVDGLAKAFAPRTGSAAQALRQVDALGVTASADQGSATYKIRLVVH